MAKWQNLRSNETVDAQRGTMAYTIQQITKVLRDPALAFHLLNAQLRLRRWTKVPLSVRLRGRVIVDGRGKIVLGEKLVLIGHVVPIDLNVWSGAVLTIGDQSVINYGTSILVNQQVTIGKRVKIGHYALILDNNQHDVVSHCDLPESKPVVIEDDVWIASRVVVLPGVRIGRNSVVASGSIVTRDVPPNCIVAGNPATIVRYISEPVG